MWISQLRSPKNPCRIVSLVPSQTELLFHLDLEKETIGITKFCVHPPHWQKEKNKIGGTKNINIDLISSLNPDLIIANKEENIKPDVMQLAERFPVWTTDVQTLEDSMEMILTIGKLTDRNEKSQLLVDEITRVLNNNKNHQSIKPIKALYLIWKDPFMSIGGDTYIHEMMKRANIENVCKNELRYPIIHDMTEKAKNADVILLSSEPYPFKERHLDELKALFLDKKIKLVDGEMFSWYGPRLLKSLPYLNELNTELRQIQP